MTWLWSRLVPQKAMWLIGVATLFACAPAPDGRLPLTVYAASSLTEAFQALEIAYEQVHPNVDVQLHFAGSQVLRLQIEQGAAVDVFASATDDHLRLLAASGLAEPPRILAQSELVVIAPLSNPAALESFEDLPRASRIIVGSEQVPVGQYTQQLLARAGEQLGSGFVTGIESRIVSRENNVRLVRSKVALGEADAAVVYRTDVSPDVLAIEIPSSLNSRVRYSAASLTHAPNFSHAASFIEMIVSSEGQKILQRHGFIPLDSAAVQ